MPISDEVIELAPVKKAKKTLIILLVAVGVAVALAVTFLVMYILKPAPSPDTTVVNGIDITESTLFSCSENGENVLYASVGNEYKIKANVSVENNTSTDVVWDVDEPSAVTIISTGDEFTFSPNMSAAGTTITITARSVVKVDVSQKVVVHIVDQAAEYIELDQYYPSGDNSNIVKITSDTISLPFYSAESLNKTYALMFTQQGKCNNIVDSETGKFGYLQITDIKNADGTDYNAVTAVSSNSKIVEIARAATASTAYFVARGEGTATVTLTARSGITKDININVKSSAELGYIENIYVFDKEIVNLDGFKITDYLNSSKTDIDESELKKAFGSTVANRAATMITLASDEIVLPYTNAAYDDIFAHVLVKPMSVQFNSDGTLKDGWYKNLTVASSNSSIVVNKKDGETSLYTKGIASTIGESCTLTITDESVGSLKTSKSINVRIVAGNTTGSFVAENSTGDTVDASSNSEITAVATYKLSLPGSVKEEEIVQNKYMSLDYKLDFDSNTFAVSVNGKARESGKIYELEKDDVSVEKSAGGSSLLTEYTAKVTVKIKVKEDAPAPELGSLQSVIFTKLGLSLSDEGNKYDSDWSGTVKFNITTTLTSVKIIEENSAAANELLAKITDNGNRAGKFERASDTTANVYIQQLNSGTSLPFEYVDLVYLTGAYKTFTAKVVVRNGVFNESNNKLTFNGNSFDTSMSATKVEITIVNLNDVTLNTLTINIYVIDAIESFDAIQSKNETYTVNGSVVSGPLSLGTAINVKYVKRTSTSYNYSGVALYIGNTQLEKGDDGKFYYPDKETGTALYSFANGYLYPECDLYEFSLESGTDVSRVTVEFLLNSKDYYIGTNKPTVNCTFTHQASGYEIYIDNEQVSIENGTFNKTINQDAVTVIRVKTKLTLASGKEEIADETVAAFVYSNIVLHKDMTDNIVGVAKEYGQGYYEVTFTAPSIGSLDEKSYATTVVYGQNNDSVNLKVQNKARQVERITVYTTCTDNGGQKVYSGELASGLDIIFGKLSAANDNYSIKLYIKADYVVYDGNVTYFETVSLSLPAYIKADISSFTPSDSNVEIAQYSQVFECTLTLNRDESDEYNIQPTITIKPNGSQTSVSPITYTAVVKAGLDSLTIDSADVHDSATTTINKNIVIEKAADLTDGVVKLNCPVTFNSLGSAYGIVYDTKNLTVANTVTVTGISYVYSVDSGLTLTVDPKLLTNRTNNVTFTFTDAISNSVFTVQISINVTAKVYGLAIAGDDVTENSIVIETDGTSGTSVTKTFGVTINGGDVNLALINLDALNYCYIAQSSDGSSFNGVGTDFTDITVAKKSGSNVDFTLTVKNTVKSSDNYYLRANIGDVYANAIKILISTRSHSLFLDNDNNSIQFDSDSNSAYTADIVISDTTDNTFTLKGLVKNDGTGLVADKTVTYSVTAGGTVTNDGKLTVTPTAISGSLTYTMSYTDVGGSGATKTITITINYTVKITEITLTGMGSEYSGNTISLYYVNDSNRTYVDLDGKISVRNSAFGIAFEAATLSITNTNSALSVSGLKIYPKANSGDISVKIKAQNGASDTKDTELIISLKSIPNFSLQSSSGTIDILQNNSVTVVPSASTSLNGLSDTYKLDYHSGSAVKSGLTLSGNTVSLDGSLTDYSAIKQFILSATVTYIVASGYNVTMEGTLSATATYTLNIACDYAPEFTMTYESGKTVSVYDSVSDTGIHVISDSGKDSYKLVLQNALAQHTSYSVKVKDGSDDVVSVASAFTSNESAVTLKPNSSGKFTIVVEARVYGIVKTTEQTYYFTYGENPSIALSAQYGGANVSGFDGTTLNIDNTTSDKKYTIVYAISGVATGATADIKVVGVDADAVSISGMTATITLSNPTTVVIDSVITVGSRKIYAERKSVEVIATAPVMSLTAADDEILPNGSANLSINDDSTVKASYSVEYSIVSGGNYLDDASGRQEKTFRVIARRDITSDQTVVVKAVVTVTSGGYIGTEYTFYKDITIKGVALPTIAWTSTSTSVEVGKTVTLNYSVNIPEGVTIGNISVTANGENLNSDTYRTVALDTNAKTVTVTIFDTDRTRAGGKLILKLSSSVIGDIHNGTAIESGTVDIVIVPQVDSVSGITVPNGIGAYDVSAAVTPYSLNADAIGNFIKSGDLYELVSISGVKLNSAESDKVSASGKMLLINDGLTAGDEITFTATVRMLSGDYEGYTITGTASVTVAGATVSAVEIAWDNSNKLYYSVAPAVNIAELSDNNISISKIDISSSDSSLIISNNGTRSASVSAVKTCNINNSNTTKNVNGVAVIITLNNGHIYYATLDVNIAAVAPSVSVYEVIGDSNQSVTDALSDSKNAGDTFAIKLEETNGFDVNITDITVDDNCITATYTGSNAIFTVSDVSVSKTCTVKLTVTVGSVEIEKSFTVDVKAVSTNAAYMQDQTTISDTVVSGSKTFTSIWTAQGVGYDYAYSMTVSANSNLSTYFTSIKITNSEGETKQEITDLNKKSVTLYFNKNGNLYYHNAAYTSFKLVFAYSTANAISNANITAVCRTYNKSYGGSYQDVTAIYRMNIVKQYTVTLNANGGKIGTVDSKPLTYSDNARLGSLDAFNVIPTRDGYTFAGWNSVSNGSGTTYTSESTVTDSSAKTLYAQWTPNTYTVTLKLNSTDTAAYGTIKVVYDSTYGALPTPTKDGYTFNGWKLANTTVTASSTVNITADTTLVADWTAITYVTVTFQYNDGTTADKAVKYASGEEYRIGLPENPTRSGYMFVGWFNGNSQINITDKVVSDVTLVAHWTVIPTVTYTVTFNANDGSIAGLSAIAVTVESGSNLNSYNGLTPNRDGYEFKGWATADDGTDTVDLSNYTITSDTTLYAVWEKAEETPDTDAEDSIND